MLQVHTQLLLGCRGSKLRFPHLSIKFVSIHQAIFSDQIESKLCFIWRTCNRIKHPISTLQASCLPYLQPGGSFIQDKGGQSFQTSSGLQRPSEANIKHACPQPQRKNGFCLHIAPKAHLSFQFFLHNIRELSSYKSGFYREMTDSLWSHKAPSPANHQ